MIQHEIKSSYEELLHHGRGIAKMVSKNSEYGIYTGNEEFLCDIVKSLDGDPDIAYVFIFNETKRQLVHRIFKPSLQIPRSLLNRDAQLTEPIHEEFLNQKDGKRYVNLLAPVISYGLGDSPRIFPNKENVGQQKTVGYVQIGLTQERLTKRINRSLFSTLLFASFAVLLGVLLTLFITRRITLPIKRQKLAAQNISEGKFDHPIEIQTSDEIYDLTQSFNHMLENLKDYRAEVEKCNAELTSANRKLQREIAERKRAVSISDSSKIVQSLQQEIAERKRAEEALQESEREARRLAHEHAVVAEIGRIISSTLNIEEVYERFGEEVRKLIPFDRVAINIINPESRTLTIAYLAGVEIPDRRQGDAIPLADTATEEALRARSGLIISMEDEKEIAARFPGLLPIMRAGLRSSMMVPLISKDEVIGVLHLRSTKPDAYTERDLRLLERVGDQIAGAIANAQLYAECKRAENELQAYDNQLRSLSSQLVLAEERERRRIAMELHDHIGQALACCKIKLGDLRAQACSIEFLEPLNGIREIIEEALRLTRSLTFELSPPILYEVGFEAAVEWLGERVQGEHGIEFHLEYDKGPKPMDDETRITLFRAVRELLMNVTKHAHAKKVCLWIERDGNYIRVHVEDDGVGFDSSKMGSHLMRSKGFGLFSVRERLNHIGGHLKIESRPNSGTRVTMIAPLRI